MDETGQPRTKTREPDVYASSLQDLATLKGEEQRIAFRRTFAALARETYDGPEPLEGMSSATLVDAAKGVLAAGLLEDLAWLAPEAAGRSLFTFAAALPPGPEQREVGRRALSMLLAGNASTFASIATVMARTGAKAFASAPVVARTALLVELPLSWDVADGSLAFTLAVRKHLARDWILAPSTRSLAARRLAGRVIERAARELARRTEQHMTSSVRFFIEDGPLKTALDRLLEDRESLVWRHVAVARGLLAGHSNHVLGVLADALSPDLSPTEWRRAATSIAALAAVRPDVALRLASEMFSGEIPRKDPGVGPALVWGLTRAAETEPEAATELLALTAGGPAADLAEAVLYVGRELGACPFMEEAMKRSLAWLEKSEERGAMDDGALALRKELLRDLDGTPRDDEPLRREMDRALECFVREGARAAHAKGLEALASASSLVDALKALAEGSDTAISRRTSFSVLRDLDASVLDRDVLVQLIRLDTHVDKARAHEETLGALRTRVARFILDREASADAQGAALEPAHLVLHLSRLRTLLHVVDSDATGWAPASLTGIGDDAARASERSRWQMTAHAVLGRIEARPSRALRRALLATLARTVDGLVRTQACDVVEALLVISAKITDPRDFDVVAEASMDTDLRLALSSYATFLRATDQKEPAKGDSNYPNAEGEPSKLLALEALAEALLPIGSARSEALRAVLTRLSASLVALGSASSLRGIVAASGEVELVLRLEASVHGLQHMVRCARERVFDVEESVASRATGARALATAIARVLSGSDDELDADSLAIGAGQLTSGVPRAIATLIQAVVVRLGSLPRDGSTLPTAPVLEEPLPEWVPPRRVLGAFYVLRPLSAGAVGSVFIVCRTEDRKDPSAERFALKVPDFSANAARHLSEVEFFNLFRAEASALVALPPHPNIAQLVTFDLAARPRPILVMELVEGPSLERVIEAGTLDLPKAFKVLGEVLQGLEVLHDASIGHLDVKPANVVLRHGESAVLVDFGLAGRNIRPGCATGPYGAPEVWGATAENAKPKPMPADVYAFGCLAYEVLTGMTLFDEPSEVALISSHIAHDGLPPKLRELSQNPKLSPLVELLFSALRRSPEARLSARNLKIELTKVAKLLEGMPWPLPLPSRPSKP